MQDMLEARADQIVEQLKRDARLGGYVDGTLPTPEPYQGTGKISLIVLGQDPTVKDPAARKAINTVLNLDKSGSVRVYLAGVCNDLGIKLTENVYATNLYKSFFVRPPTQIAEVDLFRECIGLWLPLLKEELAPFGAVPVITLGEPLFRALMGGGAAAKVRAYWGYTPEWKTRGPGPFDYVRAADNPLGRAVFPFPHQPSLRKQFYKGRMKAYTSFVRAVAFS
jgi:hypothetical protein